MKGWGQLENMANPPIYPKPGTDYYWDYPNRKWVFVEDDADMTWTLDRLLGYDAGPGEHLCKETRFLSGKEWKKMKRVHLKGTTSKELLEDAQRKGVEISK